MIQFSACNNMKLITTPRLGATEVPLVNIQSVTRLSYFYRICKQNSSIPPFILRCCPCPIQWDNGSTRLCRIPVLHASLSNGSTAAGRLKIECAECAALKPKFRNFLKVALKCRNCVKMLRIAYDVVKPILSFHVCTEAEKYFQTRS